ncbi:hypothetical protein MRX96_013956 [Rhipicephalus microplus]
MSRSTWSMGSVRKLPGHLCLLLLVLSVTKQARLNVPRLLLPRLVEVASNYTLNLVNVDERGCYEWHSSRPEVASVSVQGSCSQSAMVSAVWSQPSRQTATVLARETSTGETLRCDVIIDQVVTLKVVTTTRELLLEDSPELLEVQGFNQKGDTFSSIEGISFDWRLQQYEPVLRFVPASEWPYELPSPGLLFWESKGRRGWAALLEGKTAGTARVSVRPMHSVYKDLVPQDLELRVVDSVRLEPSTVYLLPGCQACFQLQRLMQGRPPSPVAPSERYTQRIGDSQVASLEGMCVLARKLGHTQVLLTNARLLVSPGDAWVLEHQASYWVEVQLFDEQQHRIHASEGLRVNVHFPPEYFEVNYSTENGTGHRVRTLQKGSTVIRAELLGCRQPDGSLLLATALGKQSVSIRERLTVQPEEVWLPWEPNEELAYTVEVHAYGGTGAAVRWHLGQEAPAWATIEGPTFGRSSAVVTRGGPGRVHLVAWDSHFAPANTWVSLVPIVRLEIHGAPALEAKLPAEELLVAIAMYGRDPQNQQQRPFDNCSQVSLTATVLDKGVLKPVPGCAPSREHCGSLRIAQRSGFQGGPSALALAAFRAPCAMFACSLPGSVELRLSSSASCPENKVPSSGGPLEVELVVRDAEGQQLANTSSLDVLWELSDPALAELANDWDVMSHVDRLCRLPSRRPWWVCSHQKNVSENRV